jgi:septin family protein
MRLIIQILADIHYHGIRIFQPPQYENEDEETVQENEEIIVGHSLSPPDLAD